MSLRTVALGFAFAFAPLTTLAESHGSLVSDTRTSEDFQSAFCAADRSSQHIFVLPLATFSEGATVTCEHGTSSLRLTEPSDDPGHLLVNIDPPDGVEDGFDCDGKADEGMSLVAINCLPENLESSDHR